MKVSKFNSLVPVYFLMLLVVFLLPFYSADGYSILKHTTSELGAQNTPNSGIMNFTFVMLGASVIFESVRKFKRFPFHLIVILLFGASLILSGLFSHAPISETVLYSQNEDNLHSIFASLTGLFFTLFAISYSFIAKAMKHKVISVLIGIFAVASSLLIFGFADYSGILQRIMFVVSFAWLLWVFKRQSE